MKFATQFSAISGNVLDQVARVVENYPGECCTYTVRRPFLERGIVFQVDSDVNMDGASQIVSMPCERQPPDQSGH